MIKYRWTPFHILGILLLCQAAYYFVEISNLRDSGLGGFLPIVTFFIALIILGFDFIIQYAVSKNKKAFYVTEAILAIAFAVWYIRMGGL